MHPGDRWSRAHPGRRRAVFAGAAGVTVGLLAWLALVPTGGDDAEIRTCWGMLGYPVSCESGPSWHAGVGVGVLTSVVLWLWLWARQERSDEVSALDEHHAWH